MSQMITRRRHGQTRCLHDGLTTVKMDSRIQYENAPSRGLPGIFDMPKILATLTKLLPEPEKVRRRPYDGLRCPNEWPDVFTIRAEFEIFYYRVSILCQLRESVTPALPNLNHLEIEDENSTETDTNTENTENHTRSTALERLII